MDNGISMISIGEYKGQSDKWKIKFFIASRWVRVTEVHFLQTQATHSWDEYNNCEWGQQRYNKGTE